jgi:hypothetical protein
MCVCVCVYVCVCENYTYLDKEGVGDGKWLLMAGACVYKDK